MRPHARPLPEAPEIASPEPGRQPCGQPTRQRNARPGPLSLTSVRTTRFDTDRRRHEGLPESKLITDPKRPRRKVPEPSSIALAPLLKRARFVGQPAHCRDATTKVFKNLNVFVLLLLIVTNT